MPTKSTTPNLLSKFSDLFRRASDEAADSERPAETSAADSLRHQKRNDRVRAKELNQLRKVIQDNRGVKPQDAQDVLALASSNARNSGLGALERDAVRSKIDTAQATLEQWWGPGSGHAELSRADQDRPSAPDSEDLDLDFTGMVELHEDAPSTSAPLEMPAPSTAKPPPSALDSGLQNAALLFAEGEFSAAESVLRSLQAELQLDLAATEQLSWALFDVYRCAGQQDRFEALALDYATRFGRSPAEWYALTAPPAPARPSGDQARWDCPAVLDGAALADLAARQPVDPAVYLVNWQALQHIDEAACDALERQIRLWCDKPVHLHWQGTGALMAALRLSRAASVPPQARRWWLIELDALCLLQQNQLFEELALEYCMAFEESPPSWRSVVCTLEVSDASAAATDFVSTVPSISPHTDSQPSANAATFELAGNITGTNPPALREMRSLARPVGLLTVSCARLGRVDIQAGQSLVEWVHDCHSQGRMVQFRWLPSLVLVYFHMLGMEKWASLSAGSH